MPFVCGKKENVGLASLFILSVFFFAFLYRRLRHWYLLIYLCCWQKRQRPQFDSQVEDACTWCKSNLGSAYTTFRCHSLFFIEAHRGRNQWLTITQSTTEHRNSVESNDLITYSISFSWNTSFCLFLLCFDQPAAVGCSLRICRWAFSNH